MLRNIRTSLVAQTVKHQSIMWETGVQSLGQEDPLEKKMATHSSTLTWKIPWTEERDRLESMGLQRVGHDWVTSLSLNGVEKRKSSDAQFSILYSRLCYLPDSLIALWCGGCFCNCRKDDWGTLVWSSLWQSTVDTGTYENKPWSSDDLFFLWYDMGQVIDNIYELLLVW